MNKESKITSLVQASSAKWRVQGGQLDSAKALATEELQKKLEHNAIHRKWKYDGVTEDIDVSCTRRDSS